MTRNSTLIIGAGPSGLFAAAELARHGVQARLVEREVRTHHEARATALQPGTLEVLGSVGLLPPFLAAAEHVRCSRLYGPNMAELGATSYDAIDCRCQFQCSVPQYETQRILEAHLDSTTRSIRRHGQNKGNRRRRFRIAALPLCGRHVGAGHASAHDEYHQWRRARR